MSNNSGVSRLMQEGVATITGKALEGMMDELIEEQVDAYRIELKKRAQEQFEVRIGTTVEKLLSENGVNLIVRVEFKDMKEPGA